MIITPSYVYIHVPKTGGIWCRKGIRDSGVDCYFGQIHTPGSEVMPVMNGRYSFTFVRHPVTWWRSYWAHSNRMGWPANVMPFDNIADNCLWYSYQEFMTKILNDIPGEFTRIFRQYSEGVAHVGRFENLASDLLRFTTEAGAPASVSHPAENVGDYTSDRTASTPEIDAEIMRTESEIISEFYGG